MAYISDLAQHHPWGLVIPVVLGVIALMALFTESMAAKR